MVHSQGASVALSLQQANTMSSWLVILSPSATVRKLGSL
jgi:hypothetical protein